MVVEESEKGLDGESSGSDEEEGGPSGGAGDIQISEGERGPEVLTDPILTYRSSRRASISAT